jgi:protein TonB
MLLFVGSAALHGAAAGGFIAITGSGSLPPLVIDLTQPEPASPAPAAPIAPPRAAPAPQVAARRDTGTARSVARAPTVATEPPLAVRPEEPRPAAEPPADRVAPPAVERATTPAPPAPVPLPPPPAAAAAPTPSAPDGEIRAGAATAPVSRGTAPAGGTGAGTGASGAGAPTTLAARAPGAGGSGVAAEYGPYLARFRERVQQGLRYPLAARRQGLSGTVEIDVTIDADGRVRAAEVVASSSHSVLDEAATDAVKRVGQVALPENLPRRALRVRLPLVFQLQ